MRSWKRKILPVAAATLVAVSASVASAQGGPFVEGGVLDPANFSATFTGTSDYVFRGVSQTDSNFAVQGSIDYAHPFGIYLGSWGSNVNSAVASGGIELDYYLGFANSVGDFNYDLGGTYYNYPKSGSSPEPDYFEVYFGLGYSFSKIALAPSLGGKVYYSPDFYGEDDDAYYLNGTLDLSLPWDLGLAFGLGYQDVNGDKTSPDGFSYYHYTIGLSYSLVGFDLDLTFSNTFERDESSSDFADDNMDERLIFSISRTL